MVLQIGRVASSASLLAVVLNAYIDASRGAGTNNSIVSLSEYYQIYNLNVRRLEKDPGYVHGLRH
jgi:hypothetical protein